nr:EexN family lipoprotein [uncultured Rhodopila sp.]
MRKIIAAALLLLPVAAYADQPPAMPVSWWMAHPAERNRIIRQCQDNSRLARTANCVNAEAAGQGLRAQSTYVDLRAMVMDPRYWSANSIARDAELSRCAARRSLYPADCAPAAQSALQDRK